METGQSSSDPQCGFELCFEPLRNAGRGFVFPCDAKGQVPLGSMSDRLRDNYFYARAVVGNELSWPVIRALDS